MTVRRGGSNQASDAHQQEQVRAGKEQRHPRGLVLKVCGFHRPVSSFHPPCNCARFLAQEVVLLKKTEKNLKWNLTEAQSTRFVLSPEVAQSLPSAAVACLQIHEFDSLLLLEGSYFRLFSNSIHNVLFLASLESAQYTALCPK